MYTQKLVRETNRNQTKSKIDRNNRRENIKGIVLWRHFAKMYCVAEKEDLKAFKIGTNKGIAHRKQCCKVLDIQRLNNVKVILKIAIFRSLSLSLKCNIL